MTVEPEQEAVAEPLGAMAAGESDADSRLWGMLAHLSPFAGIFLIPITIFLPFGNVAPVCVIPPLVIWMLKKDTMSFVDAHGKEALNFNIMAYIGMIIGMILRYVLVGYLILMAVGVAWMILTIIAGITAYKGQTYRHPYCLRLIK